MDPHAFVVVERIMEAIELLRDVAAITPAESEMGATVRAVIVELEEMLEPEKGYVGR